MIIDRLHSLLPGDQISTHPDQLAVVSKDESTLPPAIPLAVVWADSTQQIAEIVRLCNQYDTPLTTRGAGSALEGSTIPLTNGIVLDLSRMTSIVKLWSDDLQVEVEPGLVYDDLNSKLKEAGLFFPPSPGGSGDIATIGGMVSTNASGIYSVKYGATRDYVLALEIITGNGEIVRVGNRAVKRSSGYNLVDLVAGSEGTLAVVSKIILRLAGLPEGRKQIAFLFPDEIKAAQAVSEMQKYGIDIAAIEFLDRHLAIALNRLKGYSLKEAPMLFLEFHGPDPVLESNSALAEEICRELQADRIQLAENQNPWEIRHWATEAVKHFEKGKSIMRNDVAFPISALPEMVEFCHKLGNESGITMFTFGHVGMGLLHALMLANRENKKEWGIANMVSNRIIEKTIALGGTISGEHGIGLGHKEMFELEHGKGVDLMRGIKMVFDPKGIMNPGKIFNM